MTTKYKRTFMNILSIMVVLTLTFPGTESVFAKKPAPKVGLLLSETGKEDNSFNWMAYQGLLRAETDLGLTIADYTPASPDEYSAVLEQCTNDGNELCIAVGFGYGVSLANAARAHPKTKWSIVDWSYPDCWEGAIEGVDCGSFTEIPNVRGSRFNEKQAGYLAGVLAAGVTGSNVIGVVGGMEIPPVVAFVEGYQNGAQCTNPEMNVLSTYTGTFIDPDLGATTAEEMIAQGADVIFGAAGLTGNGAILYSAQHDKWAIGVDSDQYLNVFGEGTVDGSDKLLSSAMKRIDSAVYQTVSDFVNGAFSSGPIVYDLASDGVSLAPFHETDGIIPQEVKEELDAVKQGIIDGMINIDDPCTPPPPPTPWLIAFPENDAIEGWEWPEGATVTLTVNGTSEPDWSGVANVTTWGDPRTYVRIEIGADYDLNIGDVVELTDGVTTIAHTVQNLSVTLVNTEADTVTGAADPGAVVQAWPHGFDQIATVQVTAGDDGAWLADFTGLFDLVMGTGGRSQIVVDGNATAVDWDAHQTYDIYAYNPLTGTIQQISYLANTDEYNPSWSPNGKKVAHDVVNSDGSQRGIYIADIKTGVSTPLVGAQDGGNDAVWSQNGKLIAFDRVPAGDSSLYIVSSIGGVPTFVRSDAVSADWAPNGKRLVFQQPSDGSIRTIAVDGGKGGETLIAESGANPVWSPDGNWIAYENYGDIWKVRVNVQGRTFGDPIQVTSGPFNDGQPTWSADSMTIVYHSGFASDWDLWSVPAAGGEPTWLNGVPEFGDYDPSYAKNSSNIAYAGFSPDGQAARLWIAAFTYDPPDGTFGEGTHAYHFEFEWSAPEPGSWSDQEGELIISSNAPIQTGYVLLRGIKEICGVNISGSLVCEEVEAINPKQPMRFLIGWLPDYGEITYPEAKAHFESILAKAVWDGGMAGLIRHELIPFSMDDWPQYVCTYTAP